jgi:hypothetical protein
LVYALGFQGLRVLVPHLRLVGGVADGGHSGICLDVVEAAGITTIRPRVAAGPLQRRQRLWVVHWLKAAGAA